MREKERERKKDLPEFDCRKNSYNFLALLKDLKII